jgi:hypothetical protein
MTVVCTLNMKNGSRQIFRHGPVEKMLSQRIELKKVGVSSSIDETPTFSES